MYVIGWWLSVVKQSRSPTHNAPLPQLCAKGTSLVVALLVHCISQPRAFTGKAACSLWCGYRIVYCAIPAIYTSFVNTTLLISVIMALLPERGMAHTRSRHTITLHFHCFCICVSCSGSASCPMLHKLRKIQAHFVCTTCWYPHLPQFILFVLWQP